MADNTPVQAKRAILEAGAPSKEEVEAKFVFFFLSSLLYLSLFSFSFFPFFLFVSLLSRSFFGIFRLHSVFVFREAAAEERRKQLEQEKIDKAKGVEAKA